MCPLVQEGVQSLLEEIVFEHRVRADERDRRGGQAAGGLANEGQISDGLRLAPRGCEPVRLRPQQNQLLVADDRDRRVRAGIADPRLVRTEAVEREGRAPGRHLGEKALIGNRAGDALGIGRVLDERDRKSTRLNSSHGYISYAVFCLKKKKKPRLAATLRVDAPVYHSAR